MNFLINMTEKFSWYLTGSFPPSDECSWLAGTLTATIGGMWSSICPSYRHCSPQQWPPQGKVYWRIVSQTLQAELTNLWLEVRLNLWDGTIPDSSEGSKNPRLERSRAERKTYYYCSAKGHTKSIKWLLMTYCCTHRPAPPSAHIREASSSVDGN